jgi:hypothetical protein
MQVTYVTANVTLEVTGDVDSVREALALVADVQQLFGEEQCGCCRGERVFCLVSESARDPCRYLGCLDCGARLDLGQDKNGKGLVVRRTDKDGRPLAHDGWYVAAGGAADR